MQRSCDVTALWYGILPSLTTTSESSWPTTSDLTGALVAMTTPSSSDQSAAGWRWQGGDAQQVLQPLLSFLSRRLALANHVDTCVRDIFVISANISFSALLGYGLLMCWCSQAFSRLVDWRLALLWRSSPLDLHQDHGMSDPTRQGIIHPVGRIGCV